jgi:hypothetical protein
MIAIPIFVLVVVTPLAMLLLACSALAIWLAVGGTHIFIRMPLFLLGMFPIGLAVSICVVDFHAFHTYVFGMLLVAASLLRTHWALQIWTFVSGVVILSSFPRQLEMHILDGGLIVRVVLAASFVALLVAAIRWLGFRVVDLMSGITGLELQQGTQRDLDEWITFLDGAGASDLNHAEIMAIIREFGFSFEWQKTITIAYLTAHGRRAVSDTHGDQGEFVVAHDTHGLIGRFTQSTSQQFSIWQMMIATFVVASLLGFARNFAWSAPSAIEWKYGAPVTLGVATVTLVAIYSSLSIRNVRRKTIFACLVAVVVSAGVTYMSGFHAASVWATVAGLTMLLFSGLLFATLHRVRYHGFRLVRAEPKASPSKAPIDTTRCSTYC